MMLQREIGHSEDQGISCIMANPATWKFTPLTNDLGDKGRVIMFPDQCQNKEKNKEKRILDLVKL